MIIRSHAKRMVHWLLALVTVVFLITGFGITEFRLIETLTFGLLTKGISERIHLLLWMPFIVLLALHVYLTLTPTRENQRKNKAEA